MGANRVLGGIVLWVASIALAVVATVYLSGCYSSEKLIKVRDVQIKGPIHQLPVRISDSQNDGRLTLTPNFSVMKDRHVGGMINIGDNYGNGDQLQYDSLNNFQWSMPSYVVGLSVEYGISKHIAFSLGGNYSKTNDKKSYEWDAGIGWCFYGTKVGGRLEIGAQWQDIAYSVLLDKYQTDYSNGNLQYLYTVNRYGRYITGNFYGSLTLNTVFRGSPVNGFFRAGYGVISVLSDDMLRANEEGEISTSVETINLTPGLYFNFGKWSRLVIGCEFTAPVSMDSYTPDWLLTPTAQLDFMF